MRDIPRVIHAHMANAIRFPAAYAVEKAGSRRPGMPMGMSDLDGSVCAHFEIRPRRAGLAGS